MHIETKFNIGDEVMFKREEESGDLSSRFGKVCGIRIDTARQSKEVEVTYFVEWKDIDSFSEADLEVPPSMSEIQKAIIDADLELDAQAWRSSFGILPGLPPLSTPL